MESQIFEYKSAAGVEYRLQVTDVGFCLVDAKTDELLVDASILVHRDGSMYHWAVELSARTSNREYYFKHLPSSSDLVEFGISRRDI